MAEIGISDEYFDNKKQKVISFKIQANSTYCIAPFENFEINMGKAKNAIPISLHCTGIRKMNLKPTLKYENEKYSIFLLNNSTKPKILPVNFTLAYGYKVNRPINSIYDLTDEEFEEYNRMQRIHEFDISEFKFGSNVPPNVKKKFEALLYEFNDIWTNKTELIGTLKGFEAEITVKSNEIISCKPYKQSAQQIELINQITDELCRARIIEPSSSPYSSPCMLVPRKTGEEHLGIKNENKILKPKLDKYQDSSQWRLVCNFISLNHLLECPKYPVPIINSILEGLGPFKLFCQCDIGQAYHHVKIEKKSRKYFSFVTPTSQFQFLRLPYGSSLSPSIFFQQYTRLLAQPNSHLPPTGIFNYADDSTVCGNTWEELLKRFRYYLERIQLYNLTLKPSKTLIGVERIKILGYILANNSLSPDPSKIHCIKNFPRPFNRRSTQSFLGLLGFYRRFISRFSHHASPLINLTCIKTPFKWDNTHEESFQYLKNALSEVTMLSIFDPKKETYVFTDCSSIATGATLSQLEPDMYLRPIAFHSKHLYGCQKFYGSTQLELLGVLTALEVWKQYLISIEFTIVTDSVSLLYLKSTTMKPQILQRYALKISEFRFKILYSPGCRLNVVDSLSRYVPVPVTNETFVPIINNDQPWLQGSDNYQDPIEQIPCYQIIENMTPENFPTNTIYFVKSADLKQAQLRDKFCNERILQLSDENLVDEPTLRGFTISNDNHKVLLKLQKTRHGEQKLPVIPLEIIPILLKQCHDDPTAGHMGYKKVYDTIKERYYFPNMIKLIKQYCAECDTCQYRKCRPKKVGYLKPIYFDIPFFAISYDLIGPFPSSDGYTSIMCILDYFTKYSITEPIRNQRAETVAKVLLNRVIFVFGIPRITISDRGSQFQGEVFQEINRLLGIDQRLTVSYRACCDGNTERYNKTLIKMVSNYCDSKQKTWSRFLKGLCWAYNVTVHSSLGYSPHEVLFGTKPRLLSELGLDDIIPPTEPYCKGLHETLEHIRSQAKINLINAQLSYKKQYDKKRKPAPKYEIGDLVLLHYRKKCIKLSPKLTFHARGIYKILRKLPGDRENYVIRLINKRKGMADRELTVNADQIVTYIIPTMARNLE
jgi:RNase H-like domain found in reverse transcriptase/Integrase zinc binding domain/Reverse transcriptase (RNA-dependent DNA polymerase)